MNTKIRVISLILSAIFAISLVSCGKKDDGLYKKVYNTPAGPLKISLSYDGKDEKELTPDELTKTANSAADVFVNCYSIVTECDTLKRINSENTAILDCDEEFLGILEKAAELSCSLDGKPELFGGAYTEEMKNEAHTEESLAGAIAHTGSDKFVIDGVNVQKTDVKAQIDLYAVAVGYSSDKAVEFIKSAGVKCGSISVGNTVTAFGAMPDGGAYNIKIGENGSDEQFLSITDGAVSTVDEKSFSCGFGKAAQMKKVTVYAADAFTAQAVSNVLYFMTTDEVTELYKRTSVKFEAVMTDSDGKITTTEKLKDTVYTSQPKVTEDE